LQATKGCTEMPLTLRPSPRPYLLSPSPPTSIKPSQHCTHTLSLRPTKMCFRLGWSSSSRHSFSSQSNCNPRPAVCAARMTAPALVSLAARTASRCVCVCARVLARTAAASAAAAAAHDLLIDPSCIQMKEEHCSCSFFGFSACKKWPCKAAVVSHIRIYASTN